MYTPIAKREVPAVGDVEGSFKENPLTDSGEKCREFGRTGTTQRGVHGGVTPAGLPRGIAQRLELGRHAGIPTSVGHFGQRCGQVTHGETIAEEDRSRPGPYLIALAPPN